jgi:hypothetical protein
MSMHILPAFVTTTRNTKRNPVLSVKQKVALATHTRWVESITKGKKADKKVLDANWKSEYTNSMMVDRSAFQKSGVTPGVCAKPQEKVYSGERKLLGIATMHKSNMVPVFEKQDAEDIAKMRRG